MIRHLAFRDYLISHPEMAESYSALKWRLAQKYPRDLSYMDGKDAFIKEIEKKALGIRRYQTSRPKHRKFDIFISVKKPTPSYT